MSKPTRSIQTKVVLGYMILIAILLFSVRYIYKEMEQLSLPDDYETDFNNKRKAINDLLTQLYQTEIIGQSLSSGQFRDYPLYKDAVTKTQVKTDSLKSFITDSMQLLRIDSISELLIWKEQNMASLLKTIKNSNTDKLYQQNLEQIINQQDSLLIRQQIQHKEIVNKSSYTVNKKRKNFFKRLREVFVPGKSDSSIVTKTSKETLTDTVVQAFNPADTVANILKNIQNQVSGKRQEAFNEFRNKSEVIRYSGLIINHKISQIIKDFEKEESLRSLEKLENEKNIRKQSIQTISWIAITAVLLSVIFLIMIWKDITRSNRYRNELELAKKQAEELLITREKLMLTITHDIKSPAGSILGYADLLSHLITEKRQLFYLSNMKSSSEHLLKLVNNLLDFHRLDSNKMEVNRVTFNPLQLLQETVVSFEPMAQKKGLALSVEIDSQLDKNYISDPFRIRQISENLLSNALKFTKNGYIEFKAKYTNQYLHFTVTDTGCGISSEEQQQIFREFTRLKNAQGEEGFGLGLSITKKLTDLLEGEIKVSSSVGQGSCFTIIIPLYPVAEKNIPAIESQPTSPILQKQIKVLLIDDDRIQLNLTEAMLNQLHVKSVCCQQPDEIITLLQKENFDLLLTDVQMPSINGFELLARLRNSEIQQARAIPTIGVTARNDLNKAYFLSKGFVGCLHKPFSLNELANAISLLPFTEKEIVYPKSNKPNFEALTAFSENDPKATANILHTFVVETNKNLSILENALKNKEIKTIAAMAHKISPSFILINVSNCLEPLQWLEKQQDGVMTKSVEEKTLFVIEEIKTVIREAQNS